MNNNNNFNLIFSDPINVIQIININNGRRYLVTSTFIYSRFIFSELFLLMQILSPVNAVRHCGGVEGVEGGGGGGWVLHYSPFPELFKALCSSLMNNVPDTC